MQGGAHRADDAWPGSANPKGLGKEQETPSSTANLSELILHQHLDPFTPFCCSGGFLSRGRGHSILSQVLFQLPTILDTVLESESHICATQANRGPPLPPWPNYILGPLAGSAVSLFPILFLDSLLPAVGQEGLI